MAFVYDATSNKITCPRSNSGAVQVSVTGLELGADDVVEFYIREKGGGARLVELIEKPVDGVCVFSLPSIRTRLLPPGRYTWNLRIATSPVFDGDGRLIEAGEGGEMVTVWNRPPEFEVLEV